MWATFTSYEEEFFTSLREWSNISPGLLLFLFLPALLFGDSMEMNIRHFRRICASAVLLAGPGSLLFTFLLAACLKHMIPYSWSWDLCLVVGSILCATDPISVIALMKEAGASPSLNMLITAEALLNDG